MARLFYNRHIPVSVAASTEAVGYEALNANALSIEREYRSANLTGFQFFVVELGSLKRISGIFVNGVNSPAANAFYQFSAVNYRIANFEAKADENGRSRMIDYAGKTLLAQSIAIGIDSFAVNLSAELTHDVIVQNPGGKNCFEYRSIKSAASLAIAVGDVLKYDVKRSTSNPDQAAGGVEVDFTLSPFSGRVAGLVDQNGTLLNVGPTGATGVYFSRTILLTPISGKLLTNLSVVNESDVSGQHFATYKNIRIESAGGAVKLQAWQGVRTELNAVTDSAFASGKLIAQGDTTDGAAFWRISNLDVFQDALELPPFDWEYSVRTVEPFVGRALDNGLNPRYLSGPAYKIIKISVRRFRLEDWNPFFAALRTGRCVLDIDLPGLRSADKWPVKLESLDIERARSSFALDTFSFELREVVA